MKASEPLLRLIRRPRKPVSTGNPKAWKLVETELGTALPRDYKWFIDQFGEGVIDGIFQVLNPFAARNSCRLGLKSEDDSMVLLEVLKTWRNSEWADQFPFPPFPQSGGVLPCGASQFVVVYWLVEGKPDDWKIVVEDHRPVETTVYPETLVSFLEGVITKRIKSRGFPSFPKKIPVPFEQ